MKNRIPRFFLAAALLCFLHPASALDGVSFSGLFDIKAGGGLSNTGASFSRFESFANLRLREAAKENVVFYAAFNAQAALRKAAPAGTEAALFEVERLYLHWTEERWGLDAGLMPLHFGYGQVFAPSDFLIKRNPIIPDARAQGVAGAALYQYPHDAVKITAFSLFPVDKQVDEWQEHHFGAVFEARVAAVNVQAIYALETPSTQNENGVHFFGGSVKWDAAIGLIADGLYRYDPSRASGLEGLAASAGADYSIEKVYLLAEYLYNGKNSATHRTAGGLFAGRNFVDALLRWTVSDLTNVTLQGLMSLDDRSLLPSLTFAHDLAQGFTLSLTAQAPLDLHDDGAKGELGPDALREKFSLTAGLRLRL
jgi:hypothetical protein